MIGEPINHPSSIINQKGSIYVHVLATSLLITIIGLGAMYAVRVQGRSCRLTRDYAQARACATSAVELGLQHMKADSAWRTTWPNGTWVQNQPLGSATFTLQGIDPQDGDLADSQYDAVVLTGIGAQGVARHKVQAVVTPVIKPIEALSSALQASGSLQVKGGNKITVIGAPVATNGQLDNENIIDGIAEAQSVDHTGTITGGPPLVPGPIKRMPDADVISRYAAKAKTVTYASTLEKFVLGPGANPYGTADPNGLYVINTSNGNLKLQKCRIWGTLVILAGTGTVTLDDPVLLHNYRSDFPTLLVSGNLIIKNTSATTYCKESSCNTNLNPAAVPYLGASDTDVADSYPNEIQGLVHVDGTLQLQQTARVVGAVICNGTATVEGTNAISYTSSLFNCPPNGYTYVERMRVSDGSWKQVID
jgi:Tfp pilus assembly protein PilX